MAASRTQRVTIARALAALMAATLLASAACGAAEKWGPVAPPGPQFMLYISRPLGAVGRVTNLYGLRFERTNSANIDASTRFAAPLRHRTLIDLQFTRGSAARFQFGSRTTWDLGLRQLGPSSELVDSPWRPDAMSARTIPVVRLP
ncbi:MAG: hypothetical protein WCD08_09115 [Steroidobacteraceae bacterium]